MRKPTAWVLALALLSPSGPNACSNREPAPEMAAASQSSTLLPMTIDGMPLVTLVTGADAEAFIRRLHGKDVASVASFVGRYEGGGAEATLYLSRFAEAATADTLLAQMERAIGAGNALFAHHTRFLVDGLWVHAVLGQGKTHLFYARGRDVAWLAIDRGMARVGLADLLGVAADRVPSGIVADGIEILPPPDSLYHRDRPHTLVRDEGG